METRFARSLIVAHAPNFVRSLVYLVDTNHSTKAQQPITGREFCCQSFPLVARCCRLLH
jgi:hypothetical protein